MNTVWVIVIIVLVIGVILGNVMLLRYSTRFKMPKSDTSTDQQKTSGTQDDNPPPSS